MHWPLILDPDRLVNQLHNADLLIIDLCHPDNYRQGHVPGAVHVHPEETRPNRQPGSGLLPEKAQLYHLVQRLGITEDKHIVVYDDEGGGWAGRFIWLLDSIGHHRHSLLDGGLIAWVNEGYPTCNEPVAPAKTAQAPKAIEINPDVSVTCEQLISLLQEGNIQVWDARSYAEFSGQRIFAARGGKIPGAIHFEWIQAMDPNRNYRLKPLDTLKKTLATIGLTEARPIVTHCQTHHRSGLTYVIGKALGFDIKAYAGSWSEWGNRSDTPVEVETG
ncbi:MAG: thiosulfate sulfurtransferase [Gammaproteobacteria bacterium]|nr:MAG: thiosulfate sulfurtransferase [Gammaproteobacteria bacterium]